MAIAASARAADNGEYAGSSACAGCHTAIYRSYSATPMAHSSGSIAEENFRRDFQPGQFDHRRSRVRYRIFREREQYLFEFVKMPEGIRGRRSLDFFIGSGAAGRSYLTDFDGFLFEAPVSWYSRAGRWDLSPGFELEERVSLTRPIETECLLCHASRVQPLRGTQNGYEKAPFLDGGVGCERCHGPGKRHIAKVASGQIEGSLEIVNPAKLAPQRRDSICAQCHLTGDERVEKADHALERFRPGDLLSAFATSFVRSGPPQQGLHVTDHYEKLWESRCKKASGDRLWCGACHDPHAVPVAAQRSAYYRQKCLSCHPAAHAHASRGEDCISCHMPAGEVTDVAHAVYTDHSIPRLAKAKKAGGAEDLELVPFWGERARPRELGLAYLRIASRQNSGAGYARAFKLLKEAEADGAADGKLLTQLAYLYDRAGDEQRAALLYERALRTEPAEVEAAVNLGAILLHRGRIQDAIHLWKDALSRNPGLEAARMNLALAHFRAGNPAAARAVLLKALEYSPDLPAARKLLSEWKNAMP